MSNTVLIFVSTALYMAATAVVAWYIRGKSKQSDTLAMIRVSFGLACLAMIAHLGLISKVSFIHDTLNFSLASMVILVSGIVVLIFLLGGLAMPIRRLGVLVYPMTILSLLFALSWGDEPAMLDRNSMAFNAHILISLSAYALLAIASIQALLYVYQERQIKKRANPTMLMALPPLQTMEMLLFRLLGFGFGLLTLALLSGAAFSQQIFGHAFVFQHHTILAVAGWLVFAVLLFKRVRHGMRGSQAMVWTIAGFLLIQLGYFGTKLVSESLSVQ